MSKRRLAKPETPDTACVAVISLGCAKNLVDTEVMCGSLASAGLALTNVADAADVLLINTCCFIEDSRAESANEIENALHWKSMSPGRQLVVAGCWPQRDAAALIASFPDIDLLIGIDQIATVGDRIKALLAEPGEVAVPEFVEPAYLYDESTPRLQVTPSVYGYVKIADGCDNRCHYCAIPMIRGPQRSRLLQSVVAECRQFLAQNVLELNLIAQDTTAYGADLKDESTDIVHLLQACDELPGDFWIRLLYTHPRHFSAELAAFLASAHHVVPYIDLPLQHVTDRMLQAMGRHMAERDVKQTLDMIRSTIPDATIRTTLLVGYPGETEDDYRALCDFVQAYRLDKVGVFAFSPEAGTRAADMTDDTVPAEIAAERRDQLLWLQQKISQEKHTACVGQSMRILVEGQDPNGAWVGRTRGDAPDVDGCVWVNAAGHNIEPGFLDIRVTDADEYDLYGELLVP